LGVAGRVGRRPCVESGEGGANEREVKVGEATGVFQADDGFVIDR
jgi:hypothetical protein